MMLQVQCFHHPSIGRKYAAYRLVSLCNYITVTFTVIPLAMRACGGTDIQHISSTTNYFTLFPLDGNIISTK
jgi:hypothetical protein